MVRIFKAAQNRIPRKVFLTRWYPPVDAPKDAQSKVIFCLEQLQQTLESIGNEQGIPLELIDGGGL
jgi:hypothetical protein